MTEIERDYLIATLEAQSNQISLLTQKVSALAVLAEIVKSQDECIEVLEADHKELIERIDCLTGDPEA